jgi:hypothetical protein
MHHLRILLPVLAALACAILIGAAPQPYEPQAVYCSASARPTDSPLCSTIPGNIGPDQALAGALGYKGIVNADPTAPGNDVETPFDNLSWQTFIALNWTKGKEKASARAGLDGSAGPRVWEDWSRVSQVFGDSPVQASCTVPAGYQLFSMGSNAKGQQVSQNEEYIQAATLEPAIDVAGNWTIYERRVNGVEIAYLRAPGGNGRWPLNTYWGQQNFIAAATNTVNFPALGSAPNGAMEIKAAWRILDPAQHAANQKRFYVVRAVIAVPANLVASGGKQICAEVDLGLVAMHIIQKNPVTKNSLKPEWFWTTFEHVDNAPMATGACDITKPGTCALANQLQCPVTTLPSGVDYSYFNARDLNGATNQPAQVRSGDQAYLWNPVKPYAKNYLMPAASGGWQVGTQISRCWQLYKLTAALNSQWQAQLRAVGSVFANYMLIGTQWGANLEQANPPIGPTDAAPNYLSNSVVETFLQTFYKPAAPDAPFETGSCISCHSAATLVPTTATGQSVSSNFSFLPGLVTKGLVRTLPTHAADTKPRAR